MYFFVIAFISIVFPPSLHATDATNYVVLGLRADVNDEIFKAKNNKNQTTERATKSQKKAKN